jgi:3-hydroxyacyl-CoA dehydrogenase
MNIRKVAVIGAGVMGQAICSHMLNAGLDCLLLDLADKSADKNAIVKNAVKKIQASKPALLFDQSLLSYLSIGNLDDDIQKLKNCDLVIEAVLENNDIKRNLFNQIKPYHCKKCLLALNKVFVNVF